MTMPGRFFVHKFLREAVDAGCTHAVVEMTSEEKNNRRQAIEEFLQTENYELFTSNGFYKTILFHINEMTKIDPIKNFINHRYEK